MKALSIVLLCVGVVFLLIGIGFLFPAVIVGKLSATTKGIVKDITQDAMEYNKQLKPVEEKKNKKANYYVETGVGSSKHVGNSSQRIYHAIYFYRVNGVEYSRADGPGYNKGLAEKKIGKEVTVYYNPDNPLQASLSSGKIYKMLSISLILVGIFSSVAGLISMMNTRF